MGIEDKIDGLRDAEVKDLMMRVTIYIADELVKLYGNKWKAIEVSRATGVSNSRLSEIKRWEKYQMPVSESNLKLLIDKEVVTLSALIQNVARNEKGKAHLEKTISFVEDVNLRDAYNELKELGLNPAEILRKEIASHKKKISNKSK